MRGIALAALLAPAAALAEPVVTCPVHAPGDAWPALAVQGCPVPVSGLIFPHEHVEDVEFGRLALIDAARSLRELRAVAEEHGSEIHPLAYVISGVVLGAGAVWVATAAAP